MFFYLFSVEESLEEPNEALGDEMWSPLHQCPARARCPVLHLFGHLHFYPRLEAQSSFASNKTSSEPSLITTACLHVHGVYPYLHIRQRDRLVGATQFGVQLERAMREYHEANRSAPQTIPRQGGSSRYRRRVGGDLVQYFQHQYIYIHNVRVEYRECFYGYHEGRLPYYRIECTDPSEIPRVRTVLLQFAKKSSAPHRKHEAPASRLYHPTFSALQTGDICNAHSSYSTRFLTDFGLRGGNSAFLFLGHAGPAVDGSQWGKEAPCLLLRLPRDMSEDHFSHSMVRERSISRPEALQLWSLLSQGGAPRSSTSTPPAHCAVERKEGLLEGDVASRVAPLSFTTLSMCDGSDRFPFIGIRASGISRRTSSGIELDLSMTTLDRLLHEQRATLQRPGGSASAAPSASSVRLDEGGASHLCETRCHLRDFFTSCGLPDALRLAATIGEEEAVQEAMRTGNGVESSYGVPLRYGTANAQQSKDPFIRAMFTAAFRQAVSESEKVKQQPGERSSLSASLDWNAEEEAEQCVEPVMSKAEEKPSADHSDDSVKEEGDEAQRWQTTQSSAGRSTLQCLEALTEPLVSTPLSGHAADPTSQQRPPPPARNMSGGEGEAISSPISMQHAEVEVVVTTTQESVWVDEAVTQRLEDGRDAAPTRGSFISVHSGSSVGSPSCRPSMWFLGTESPTQVLHPKGEEEEGGEQEARRTRWTCVGSDGGVRLMLRWKNLQEASSLDRPAGLLPYHLAAEERGEAGGGGRRYRVVWGGSQLSLADRSSSSRNFFAFPWEEASSELRSLCLRWLRFVFSASPSRWPRDRSEALQRRQSRVSSLRVPSRSTGRPSLLARLSCQSATYSDISSVYLGSGQLRIGPVLRVVYIHTLCYTIEGSLHHESRLREHLRASFPRFRGKSFAKDELLCVCVGIAASTSRASTTDGLVMLFQSPLRQGAPKRARSATSTPETERSSLPSPKLLVEQLTSEPARLLFDSELELVLYAVALLQVLDPDVLLSWNVEDGGLGTLAKRYDRVIAKGVHRRFGGVSSASQRRQLLSTRGGFRALQPLRLPTFRSALSRLSAIVLPFRLEEARAASQDAHLVSSDDSESSDISSVASSQATSTEEEGGEEAEALEDEPEEMDDEALGPDVLNELPAHSRASHILLKFPTQLRIRGRCVRSLCRDIPQFVQLPSYSLSMVYRKLMSSVISEGVSRRREAKAKKKGNENEEGRRKWKEASSKVDSHQEEEEKDEPRSFTDRVEFVDEPSCMELPCFTSTSLSRMFCGLGLRPCVRRPNRSSTSSRKRRSLEYTPLTSSLHSRKRQRMSYCGSRRTPCKGSIDAFSRELSLELYPDPGFHCAALHHIMQLVRAWHRIVVSVRYTTRTQTFASMLGILFEEVISRGSQFKVESTLNRLARATEPVACFSPTLEQVHQQPKIQCVALILTPRPAFYDALHPLLVLDFRSLYPSIIMAYNLCYSTCIGRLKPSLVPLQSGINDGSGAWAKYYRPPEGDGGGGRQAGLGVVPSFDGVPLSLLLSLLRGREKDPTPRPSSSFMPIQEEDASLANSSVFIAPCGSMFVKPFVRVGLLPQMIREILDTRFQVQSAMRYARSGTVLSGASEEELERLQTTLNEQQMALKMLANTTYGYTAASYTGKMPCVDVSEAIVSLGRRTLENAIELVRLRYGEVAEVVYGDTDSLFVCVPIDNEANDERKRGENGFTTTTKRGSSSSSPRRRPRNMREVFELGYEIAQAVTAALPSPIMLEFEKVLCPALLLVKKRYCGFSWTSPPPAPAAEKDDGVSLPQNEKQNIPEPKLLCKGLETVRRDACSFTSFVLKSLLYRLFQPQYNWHWGGDPREGLPVPAPSVDALKKEYSRLVAGALRHRFLLPAFIFRRGVKLAKYSYSALRSAGRLGRRREEGDTLSDDAVLRALSCAKRVPMSAHLALQEWQKKGRQAAALPYYGERRAYVLVGSAESITASGLPAATGLKQWVRSPDVFVTMNVQGVLPRATRKDNQRVEKDKAGTLKTACYELSSLAAFVTLPGRPLLEYYLHKQLNAVLERVFYVVGIRFRPLLDRLPQPRYLPQPLERAVRFMEQQRRRAAARQSLSSVIDLSTQILCPSAAPTQATVEKVKNEQEGVSADLQLVAQEEGKAVENEVPSCTQDPSVEAAPEKGRPRSLREAAAWIQKEQGAKCQLSAPPRGGVTEASKSKRKNRKTASVPALSLPKPGKTETPERTRPKEQCTLDAFVDASQGACVLCGAIIAASSREGRHTGEKEMLLDLAYVCAACWACRSPQAIYGEVVGTREAVLHRLRVLEACCEACLSSAGGLIGGERWLSEVLLDGQGAASVPTLGAGGMTLMTDLEDMSQSVPFMGKLGPRSRVNSSSNREADRKVCIPKALIQPPFRFRFSSFSDGVGSKRTKEEAVRDEGTEMVTDGCVNIDCSLCFMKRELALEAEQWSMVVEYVELKIATAER